VLGKKILFSADKVSEPAIKIQNNKNMSLVDIYLVYFFWRVYGGSWSLNQVKDGCAIAHFSVGENAMYVFAKLKGLMETKRMYT
jgi:hypothetical protein